MWEILSLFYLCFTKREEKGKKMQPVFFPTHSKMFLFTSKATHHFEVAYGSANSLAKTLFTTDFSRISFQTFLLKDPHATFVPSVALLAERYPL